MAEQKDFLLFVGGCLLLIGAGVLYFSYCNQQVLSQRLNAQQNEIYNLRSNFRQMNSQSETMQSQIYFDQTAIELIFETLSRRPGLLRPPGPFLNLRRPHILTQDRIGEITAAMLRKYGNQPLNTLEVCEFINLLYYP